MNDTTTKTEVIATDDDALSAEKLHVETDEKAGRLRLFGNSGIFDFNHKNDVVLVHNNRAYDCHGDAVHF